MTDEEVSVKEVFQSLTALEDLIEKAILKMQEQEEAQAFTEKKLQQARELAEESLKALKPVPAKQMLRILDQSTARK